MGETQRALHPGVASHNISQHYHRPWRLGSTRWEPMGTQSLGWGLHLPPLSHEGRVGWVPRHKFVQSTHLRGMPAPRRCSTSRHTPPLGGRVCSTYPTEVRGWGHHPLRPLFQHFHPLCNLPTCPACRCATALLITTATLSQPSQSPLLAPTAGTVTSRSSYRLTSGDDVG